MGRLRRDWQDTGTVLAYFGKGRRGIEKYEQYVREGISKGKRPELVGGGLIRSLGGWSQVLPFRRKGMKVASDERVLGGDEFIERLLTEVDKRERETLRLFRKVPELPTLAGAIVKGEEVGEQELRSGIRKREVGRARRLFCQLAVGKMGYPGAEVARFLGVTTSAVNRLVVSKQAANLTKYLKLF
jgi:hypothetical protein